MTSMVRSLPRDTVMWLWSAYTLFWQLSIEHNMDVYYQAKHRLQSTTLARKFDIEWCGEADGRMIKWLQKCLWWIDYQIFLGMGLR